LNEETIEPEAKTPEAGGSNSLGKDQPQYAGDRGYVQTCCDAGSPNDNVGNAGASYPSLENIAVPVPISAANTQPTANRG
jgi:hypothetical protein